MQSIYTIIEDHEFLLEMEPEQLAGLVLHLFNSSVKTEKELISISYFVSDDRLRHFPDEHQTDIRFALLEALEWLKNEGLIASEPDTERRLNQVFITRRGQKFKTPQDVEVYRKKTLLPKELLHPAIVDKVWLLFLQGDYNSAVFQAFRSVEIAVRDVGDFADEVCDVELMEEAFNPETGVLTQEFQIEEEKQATFALFSGAMGLYKKPTSHRNLYITSDTAIEKIIFASHLLKIVDSTISESTPAE